MYFNLFTQDSNNWELGKIAEISLTDSTWDKFQKKEVSVSNAFCLRSNYTSKIEKYQNLTNLEVVKMNRVRKNPGLFKNQLWKPAKYNTKLLKIIRMLKFNIYYTEWKNY